MVTMRASCDHGLTRLQSTAKALVQDGYLLKSYCTQLQSGCDLKSQRINDGLSKTIVKNFILMNRKAFEEDKERVNIWSQKTGVENDKVLAAG